MTVHSAAADVRFDFGSTALVPWQVVNDDVMGGSSTCSWVVTNGVARLAGELSLVNHGGFASARSQPGRHHMGAAGGFLIRVRGDARTYKPSAQTGEGFESAVCHCALATRKG